MVRGFRRSVGGCSYAEMGCASGLGGDGGGTFDLGCLKDGGARAWQTGAGRDAWVEAGSGIGDWTAWARQTCRELAPAWKMFPNKDAHHKGGDHGGKHLVSEELVREADARSEPKTTCVPGRLATVRGPMTVNQAKRHCLERGLPGFVYRHQPAPGGHSKKYGTGAQVWCLSEVTDPTGARFEQNANYDVYVAMPAQTPTETPAETHAVYVRITPGYSNAEIKRAVDSQDKWGGLHMTITGFALRHSGAGPAHLARHGSSLSALVRREAAAIGRWHPSQRSQLSLHQSNPTFSMVYVKSDFLDRLSAQCEHAGLARFRKPGQFRVSIGAADYATVTAMLLHPSTKYELCVAVYATPGRKVVRIKDSQQLWP